MSSEVPIQIVVAAFQDENGADNALKQLRAAQSEGLIKIDDAAVLRRDADDKLHIMETADMGGGKGATIGGVTGAVLGVLGGPAVWAAAGVGALVGGLAAKLHDTGFPNERLEQVGQALRPGTSAIVAVMEHTWVRKVEQELAQQGADIVTESLRQDIASQLEAGRDVAYSALSASGVLAAERSVSGEGHAEVSGVVATDQGVYAGSVVVYEESADDAPPPAAAPADQQEGTTSTPDQPPANPR
jgi:uncharacterized membrane protein